MLIFLGDSQCLGYELAEEVQERLPDSFDHGLVHNELLSKHDPQFEYGMVRPDLAFPHLVASDLSEKYINLAHGGTGNEYALYQLQKYLTENLEQLRLDHKDITVVLYQSSLLRRLFVNSFDFSILTYMSRPNEFTQETRDVLDRYSCYPNIQAANQIFLMCSYYNLNFLSVDLHDMISPGTQEQISKFSIIPEENMVPRDVGFMGDNFLKYHFNCKAQRYIADQILLKLGQQRK